MASSQPARATPSALLDRAVELAKRLQQSRLCTSSIPRGGRKAHHERNAESRPT